MISALFCGIISFFEFMNSYKINIYNTYSVINIYYISVLIDHNTLQWYI